MKEELIKLSTAKLAKEKGFIYNREEDEMYELYEPNRMSYYFHRNSKKYSLLGDFYCDTNQNFAQYNLNDKYPRYDAPTQSFLQKWLRENHKIEIYIRHWNGSTRVYEYVFHYTDQNKISHTVFSEDRYVVYEEALEEALFESLKLI